MAAFNKINTFVEAMASGVIRMSTLGDTFSIMLSNVAPTSTFKTSTDVTEISTGNGYAHLGSTCQITSSTLGSTTIVPTPVIVLGPASVVFTASGGTIGPFRYPVLLDQNTAGVINSTTSTGYFPSNLQTSTGGPPAGGFLVGYYDYGSALTLNNGETFTITFDASSGILQVA